MSDNQLTSAQSAAPKKVQGNAAPRKAIVVGSGMAGLTAAALMARAGLSVTILEKAPQVGGRAMSTHEQDFWLNLGPRAVYPKGHAHKALLSLDVPVSGHFAKVNGFKTLHNGRLHAMPTGGWSFLTTSLLPFSAKLEGLMLLPRLPGLDAEALQGLSVAQWLDKQVKHPALREYLEAILCLNTYVSAPKQMDAATNLRQLQHSLKEGVMYVDGGWQSLVDGLMSRCKALGVRVQTGARAEGLRARANGGYEVTLAHGAPLEADAVVLAVDPSLVAELVTSLGSSVKIPRPSGPATHAACLDVALSSLPNPGTPFVLGVDAPLYLSVHSLTAKLHPGEGAVIHVMKYLAPEAPHDPRRDRAELEALLDLAQPGWREKVVHQRFLPHMTVMHGMPTAETNGLAGRPSVAVSGQPGLFVAGDWVGSQGLLLDASVASASTAAQKVVSWLTAQPVVETGRAPVSRAVASARLDESLNPIKAMA